jgi:hypothetical protein
MEHECEKRIIGESTRGGKEKVLRSKKIEDFYAYIYE